MTTTFISGLSLVCSVEGEEAVGLREPLLEQPINRSPDQNSATPSVP